ncbi:MAG: HAMP domain-containing sensor histidine kinase [Eubacteriales bacterium]|nr:HAMP domain-containing sensor histidine kinase [Eubacteriales bacterium]
MVVFVVAAVLFFSGLGWYGFFYRREKRLLRRLQFMVDQALEGHLERSEISEESYSALENSLKKFLDESLLAKENQKRQNEITQRFLSDIAHQTLTPISNLKIYGELLAEADDSHGEIVRTLLEQTEKLDFLIQSLVKLSRMESGIITVHPEQNSVGRLCKDLEWEYREKAREKKITLSVSDAEVEALFDVKWTKEALGNIVDNALKYTPEGGQVEVLVEQYSFFVRLDITDTGIGMEEEEIPLIFNRFYRSMAVREQPGVGIGLALAREIIRAQKGYIKVSSKKGKGSIFSVFLPAGN